MAAAPHVQITFKVRAGERTGVWSQGARASGESVHGPMSLGEQVRRTVDDVHVYHEGGEDVVVDAELEPGAERGSQGGRRGVRRLSARLTKTSLTPDAERSSTLTRSSKYQETGKTWTRAES